MGVAESIGTIMVIGFSVDYVVHLAAHYIHSATFTRFQRSREAIGEMGISIFSGAMTTIGCGSFLFGGQMNVFQKFAFILTTTCAIAIVYSLVYFIALSHGFGPEGRSGSFARILTIFRKIFRPKEESRAVGKEREPEAFDDTESQRTTVTRSTHRSGRSRLYR